MTSLHRRTVLSLGALLLAPLSKLHAKGESIKPTMLLSAASDIAENNFVVGVHLQGELANKAFSQPLPARGHHVAHSEIHGVYIAVARRPGKWIVLGSLSDGSVLQEVSVPDDRHLYGHGVFSSDEQYFYTTESRYDDRQGENGLLVEWQLVQEGAKVALERRREFSSGGIGPHELVLMPDNKTLAIANGGLRTHPDQGREVLNLESMQPSLVYLDTSSGNILERHFLPEEFRQASIRHLDVNAKGALALGLQFQGEPWMSVPLVASHQRGGELQLHMAPEQVQSRMQQYVGSVRFSVSGDFFAASCPRGNLITFWDIDNGSMLRSIPSRDGCGLLATQNGFIYSSGTGKLTAIDLLSDELTEIALPEPWELFWDNHLSVDLGQSNT